MYIVLLKARVKKKQKKKNKKKQKKTKKTKQSNIDSSPRPHMCGGLSVHSKLSLLWKMAKSSF